MNFKSSYLQRVYDGLESRNAEQKEFLQAVREVLESLEPVVAANPKLEELGIIERIAQKQHAIKVRKTRQIQNVQLTCKLILSLII